MHTYYHLQVICNWIRRHNLSLLPCHVGYRFATTILCGHKKYYFYRFCEHLLNYVSKHQRPPKDVNITLHLHQFFVKPIKPIAHLAYQIRNLKSWIPCCSCIVPWLVHCGPPIHGWLSVKQTWVLLVNNKPKGFCKIARPRRIKT